ncbi:DNA starvation/stationary phase protection protein [Paenibacillus sp. P96]|uniref:DNA starvation/stationary phase protection protein n=1 Tax=Paenibacillus zeirhizosphaerae TaxID=2987519 RepID=A0ABT9FNC8_9BACL|nr:Dps family protein [Paenibacillus sp. P96]MDP4096189.1 DNA starvation/stationary phase protection protein [Paenibacillus sp. P96]
MSTLKNTNTNSVEEAAVHLYEALNRQVATWSVLYTKLHHFHWYVKGPHFFRLHAKFEELYDEAAGHLDTIAERLLAIGGRPAATMAEYLQLSIVREAEGQPSAEEMVATVVSDLKLVASDLATGMESAESAGDPSTADILNGMRESVDKHIWMLNAFLGK